MSGSEMDPIRKWSPHCTYRRRPTLKPNISLYDLTVSQIWLRPVYDFESLLIEQNS